MLSDFFAVAYLIVTLVGVALALDAILNARTAQGTLAWVVALVLFPVLAIPLYFVFGARRFNGYVRARRRGNSRINQLASAAYQALKPYATTSQPTQRGRSMDFLGLLPMTGGNDATLLINGGPTFEAIFRAIDAATDYVIVQFYIVRDDSIGRRLYKHLQDARGRGVRCFVLYDQVGSSKLGQLVLAMKGCGILVSPFKTTKGPRNRFQINFRNHRKVVVVDGRVAFIGGINVGDEYADLDPTCAPWRDTHIELKGPCVQAVQMSFCEDWNWAVGNVPDLNWAPAPQRADEPVLVIPSGPADPVETFLLLTLQLIAMSRERIWIASPYFVPDESIIAALQLAALRGVDVRVIFPARPDNFLVKLAARSVGPDLIPAGVKMYSHGKGFMHQKVMVFDDIGCVGSANIDNRSLRINFEMTALVDDAGFAAECIRMLETDLLDCTAVPSDEWSKLSLFKRLTSRTARMFAPIL
ncbi:MAG: cardiolipin synthase [Phycisphaerales bacterium]|nr:cardiolipin synthase [Phycisphaerales bacterium]